MKFRSIFSSDCVLTANKPRYPRCRVVALRCHFSPLFRSYRLKPSSRQRAENVTEEISP